MKKLSILIIMAIVFSSCQKNQPPQTQNNTFEYTISSNIPYSQIKKRAKGFSGKNGSTEILVFNNMETFKLTLADLDRQVQELDSIFVTEFIGLDEDALNEKEIALGFNEKKPLIDFSSFFLYRSLYQEIDSEKEQWLNNEVLNETNDPDNHFVIEHAVRAMLNTDCEVQIADSIYKLTSDGYFVIPAENLKSLQLLDMDQEKWQTIHNVFFSGDECVSCKASGCNSNKRNSNYAYNSAGNRRIQWVVSHWTHPWNRRCIAKVDNYKKKGNRWVKFRTNCFAKVYGYVSNTAGQCDGQSNFNTSNTGLGNYNAKHIEHKIDVQTKTKSSWVQAYFYGADGVSHHKTLTW